jgi:RNA polymerase sigma-70 factor (ECF subfamily)
MAPQVSDEPAQQPAAAGKGAPGKGPILHLVPQTSAMPASAERDAEQARLAGWVARMAGGDEEALALLYDATVGRVYGYALRVLRNSAAAEEIVSDVYLQAWRDAVRYAASRSRVTTWLTMLCRSRAIDWMRGRDPEVAMEHVEELIENEPSPTAGPEELFDMVEGNAVLVAALEALSPIQRQTVALAFFRGLSHQEIAEHLRMPLGTVKGHMRRALEVLRRELGPAAAIDRR